jgi:hypothetical protein
MGGSFTSLGSLKNLIGVDAMMSAGSRFQGLLQIGLSDGYRRNLSAEVNIRTQAEHIGVCGEEK